MTLSAVIELEQHVDPSGDTVGWLARYDERRALWCGEITHADFMRQSIEIRTAMRDDLGWYLLDLDHCPLSPNLHVLARVCKASGLEMLRTVLLGRLAERQRPALTIEALRIVGSGPPSRAHVPSAFSPAF